MRARAVMQGLVPDRSLGFWPGSWPAGRVPVLRVPVLRVWRQEGAGAVSLFGRPPARGGTQ